MVASSAPAHPPIRAVVFDIGGVVVASPLVQINLYERQHDLPRDYLNVAITARGRDSAFQRLERGEIDVYSFYRRFGEELSDAEAMNEWYTAFCQRRKREVPPLPKEVKVDGRELFGLMMRGSTTQIDPRVACAIRKLRESGRFQVAALTNNFAPPRHTDPAWDTAGKGTPSRAPTLDEELEHLGFGSSSQRVRDLFDVYIESCVVGLRKPDPAIFRYTLDKLGVRGEECAFLDDIGLNLSSAAKLGIRTIRVSPKSSLPALRELESMTGVELVRDEWVEDEVRRLASWRPETSAPSSSARPKAAKL